MHPIEPAEVYNLLMLITGLTQIKRRIMIVLAHLFPQAISGTQLTQLIGYSSTSGQLYRGILDSLQTDQLIHIDHLTNRLYSIRINHQHPLLTTLISLCQTQGGTLTKEFQQLLNPQKEA